MFNIRESDCYPGKRVGKLTLISREYVDTKSYGKRWEWTCKCDCGNLRKVYTFRLGSQNHGKYMNSGVQDCGNHTKEKLSAIGKKGKKSKDSISDANESSDYRKLYIKWVDMNKRCYNEKSSNYHSYGARGISVCPEWRNDYNKFKEWAISVGYKPTNNRSEQTLDRIDVNGNYEPNNCRFVTSKVQNLNKRNTVKFTFNFEDLADITGKDITYLRNQYYHNIEYKKDNKLFIKDMLIKEVG